MSESADATERASFRLGSLAALPTNLFRYIGATSALHQVLLVAMTITVFLLELVPLELQRRIVNDVVKQRQFRLVIVLCLLYAAIVLGQGGAKLVLNVYRGWVGERAIRDLRERISALSGSRLGASADRQEEGVEIAMIVGEVEPIGGFVGESLSEPILQGGILLSVIAYMIHLDPWMAALAVVIFIPQLVFVPLLQSAIVGRAGIRVQVLRRLSIGILARADGKRRPDGKTEALIERAFALDMGIFRLKFTMNFLMNFCSHLQVIAALLLGGWYVLHGQLEIGGVVAFISAVGRLTDPWGDLVNYFRDVSVTQLKYRLVAAAVNELARRRP